MLNKSKFIEYMSGICELFNKQPSKFTFNVYYEILKNYSEEEVRKAFIACIKTHKYNTLPKPADILEFLEDTKDDKALGAWLQVKEALEKGEYYYSVEFADPVISHCINAISSSWMQFCNDTMLKKDMPFIERRFLDMYKLFLKQKIDKPEKLIGFIEAGNRQKGLLKDIPKPIKIGGEGEKKLLGGRDGKK